MQSESKWQRNWLSDSEKKNICLFPYNATSDTKCQLEKRAQIVPLGFGKLMSSTTMTTRLLWDDRPQAELFNCLQVQAFGEKFNELQILHVNYVTSSLVILASYPMPDNYKLFCESDI